MDRACALDGVCGRTHRYDHRLVGCFVNRIVNYGYCRRSSRRTCGDRDRAHRNRVVSRVGGASGDRERDGHCLTAGSRKLRGDCGGAASLRLALRGGGEGDSRCISSSRKHLHVIYADPIAVFRITLKGDVIRAVWIRQGKCSHCPRWHAALICGSRY